MILIRFLNNQFSTKYISKDLLNSVSDFLVGKNTLKTMDYIRLENDSENMRTSHVYKCDDKTGLIHPTNESKIIDDTNSKYSEFLEKYLQDSLINLNNDDNCEINFDKFKDIVFNLPFISDLIRASCGFNYSQNENFIRTLKTVKVELTTYENNKTMNFIFTKTFVK
jgi:hypothetical protein